MGTQSSRSLSGARGSARLFLEFLIAQCLMPGRTHIACVPAHASKQNFTRSHSMRFMIIVIPKGYESAAPDAVPSAEAVAKMMEYNKSLQTSGRPACARWPSTPLRRGTHLLLRRESHRDRWSLPGNKGGNRRLLDHSGALPRRSNRMGPPSAHGQQRNPRGSPDPRNE